MILYLPLARILCEVNILKNNIKVLVSILCIISSCVFTIMFMFINDNDIKTFKTITSENKKGVTLVSNNLEKEDAKKEEVSVVNEEVVTNTNNIDNTSSKTTVVEEVVEKPVIVYDGMTMDELSSKLDRVLKNELSGKGYLYASYSLEKNVDPYLAVAISLEETGCNYNCSNLVKSCNNVGGMIGTGCNGFSAWPTLDDGIRAFIDNIYRNYVAYGLTTADTMNPKYAENPMWSSNVNNYISIIKNN